MTSPASPAETRAFIIESLVGDIGEPDHVMDAARVLAKKSVAPIVLGFADTMGISVGVELTAVDLGRIAYAKPQGAGCAMTVISSGSSPDGLILSLDPAAVALIVNLLFGGDPSTAPVAIERDLSPTEIEVATLVFEEVAKAIDGASQHAFQVKFPVPAALTATELAKHVLRDGPGVRAVFTLSTPAGSGTITLTMPQRLLLKNKTAPAAAAAGHAGEWTNRFGEEVMRSGVELQATMPLAKMTLGDLAGLYPGQLIEFEENAQSQARLSARQKTLFICEFGKLGQNYTVRIKHPFDAGQDFIDGLLPA